MNTTPQNIAILGAGITGLTTSHILQKSGHKTTIFDPSPQNNASAIAGGMLAPYSEIEHMSGEWINAGLKSIEFWSEFSKHNEIEFHQNGSTLLAHQEDQYVLERFKSHLPPQSFQTSPPPQNLKKFQTALHLKQEAHLDPQKTMQALTTEIKLLKSTPEDLQNNYDIILDCRGMGANETDNNLRGVKGEILTVKNPDFHLDCPVRLMHPRYPLYIIPRSNNVFVIGATNIESSDNTNVSLRSGMELMSALYSLHSSFGEADILSITAGIRPAYPDNLPRITIEGNIIRCNGLYRHGYLLAPVMAECVKEYIQGNKNEFFNLFTQNHLQNKQDNGHENKSERRGKGLRSAA